MVLSKLLDKFYRMTFSVLTGGDLCHWTKIVPQNGDRRDSLPVLTWWTQFAGVKTNVIGSVSGLFFFAPNLGIRCGRFIRLN